MQRMFGSQLSNWKDYTEFNSLQIHTFIVLIYYMQWCQSISTCSALTILSILRTRLFRCRQKDTLIDEKVSVRVGILYFLRFLHWTSQASLEKYYNGKLRHRNFGSLLSVSRSNKVKYLCWIRFRNTRQTFWLDFIEN